MADDWDVVDGPGASSGYLNDTDFSAAMDSTFGAGNWSQTGGWRSQARENALRAQGAQTVAPGHVSAHTAGDIEAPGARDISVKGMTPEQAAAKLQSAGLPTSKVFAEGAAGTQGAHVHVAMNPGEDPWAVAQEGHDDPWAVVDQPAAPKPAAKRGLLEQAERAGASAVGGIVKGAGDLLHSLGITNDAIAQNYARQIADTGMMVVGESVVQATPEQIAEAKAAVASHKKYFSPDTEPTAKAIQEKGEAIAPKNRNLLESVLHGGGEMVPALGAAAANPALGAGVFAVQGYAEAYDDAIAHGATPEVADKAGRENAVIQGGMMAVPVGHAAQAVSKGIGNTAARVGARYAAGAAGNAALMGSMRAGGNVVARQTYDPDRDWADQVPQAMAQGAVGDLMIHGAHDAAGTAVRGAQGLLRPREAPTAQPGAPTAETMPETDAIRAYAGQGPASAPPPPGAPSRGAPEVEMAPGTVSLPAVGMQIGYRPGGVLGESDTGTVVGHVPDRNAILVKGSNGVTVEVPATQTEKLESTWTPEREAQWQEWAKQQPGAEPVQGDPILFQTPEGIAHGTVTGEQSDHQLVVDTPAGPVIVPPDHAVPLPKDYEAERVAHGAPLEQMPQAIADVGELRAAAPKGYSLFQAMKDLGGIRTKDADGSPTDAGEVLNGVRRPGLVNNKTGLSPDAMRAALQERGWFGEFDQSQQAEDLGGAKKGDDINELFELMRREATGKKVLHPSEDGTAQRRTDLEEQMRQAGVAISDAPETAAAKLAAWRGEQVLARTPEADALRARAEELGVTARHDAGYDELLADVLEREAIQSESDGWTGDHYEDRIDHVLTPEEHEWLSEAGRRSEGEPDPPYPFEPPGFETGDQSGEEEGAGQPRAGAGGGGEGPQGVPGPDQLGHGHSWVVVDRATGKPVMETFERDTAAKVNTERYEVLPALDWLQRYNRAVRLAGGAEPSSEHLRQSAASAATERQDRLGPRPHFRQRELTPDEEVDHRRMQEERAFLQSKLREAKARGDTEREGILRAAIQSNANEISELSSKTLVRVPPEGHEPLGLTGDDLKFAKPPVFYSALERHIDGSTLKSATPEQWKATIRNAPGLKKEELEWTGVNDWLDLFGGEKVPKDKLQAFIRDNGVKVEEKTLNHDGFDENEHAHEIEAEQEKLTNARRDQLYDAADRQGIDEPDDWVNDQLNDEWGDLNDRAVEAAREAWEAEHPAPEFQDWSLPGGEDYHELLLTLPKEANPPATHWDTPGVLAHVRFDTRTGPDGKKVLFVQEIQSDWHQKGRDQGYRAEVDPTVLEDHRAKAEAANQRVSEVEGRLVKDTTAWLDRRIPEVKAEHDDLLSKEMSWDHPASDAHLDKFKALKNEIRYLESLKGSMVHSGTDYTRVRNIHSSSIWDEARHIPEELRDLKDEANEARLRATEANLAYNNLKSGGIPNAPFKSSWPALVMKRVIRWAVDHDMDRIAWTTGEQQGERYDLTKHVGRLTLHDNTSSGIGRPDLEGPFNGGTLTIHDPNGNRVGEHHIRGASSPENARKALEDVIGKELTERLLTAAPREGRSAGMGVRERHLEGLDVKIGDEGMRAFYDRNLVNITNDLIKKYGGKVEQAAVHTGEETVSTEKLAEIRRHSDEAARHLNEYTAAHPEETEDRATWTQEHYHAEQALGRADRALKRAEELHAGTSQHAFDITPQMAEAASGGLPLFKRKSAPSEFRQPKGVVVGAAAPGDREAQTFADKVEAAIRKIAPFAEVVPARHITEIATGDKAMGVSWRDGLRHIIGWAVDSKDAIGIGRHEAVHALRGAGLIRPHEWEALEEAATNEGWGERYNIARRYGELDHDKQTEEAVAERFREWRRDGEKGLTGLVHTIFQRIAKVLDQVRDLAKRTFGAKADARDILSRMESGEIGRRMGKEYNPRPTPAPHDVTEPAFARRPVNPRNAERAQREAEAQREIDQKEGRGYGFHPIEAGIDAIMGPVEWGGRKLYNAADRALPDPISEALEDTGHAVNMAVNPMAAGSPRAQAAAKDFANALRLADYQHERLDKWLDRTFTDEQKRRMWEAADEEGVILRRGQEPGPGQGLGRLTPEERAAVLNLQARADHAFDEAKALGMVKGDGLESYVPRMVVQMTMFGPKVLEKGGPGSRRAGGNLSTTTGQLRQRKYETTAETEAAADAAFGNKATVVRNIRTLPLATQRLERAVAGRTLVNRIKELSAQTGEPLVVEGQKPNDHYFTMDHPALQVWKPRFVTDPETGKTTAAVDQTGDVIFDAHPLWVAREFEGPLKAVLSTPTGPIVRAIAELKAKMMGVIMYSPLMHNAVIWGRALAADPVGVASLEAYRRGSRAKADPETMAQAIRAGLVPISRHFDKIDTASIANSGADFVPGRSWTSQVLGFIPNLFSKDAGDAVKEKVDQFGDLWHNTFLWDRVGDLQMGLYVKMRDDLVRKSAKFGINADTAQKIAAHYANRYAGSLPTEGMSKVARQLANWVLFSRSFTLGNMAAFKDVVKGLPSDVRGQIERDAGAKQLEAAQGVARRKGIGMLVLDAAFAYAGLWLAAGAVAWLTHQRFQAPSDNEEKYKNRFILRYQADGTAIYGRLPTGKTVEDQWHWLTQPVTTLHQKLSPYGRLVSAIWSNDKGFGRKLYDPYDHTAGGVAKNVGRIVWDTMQSIAPTGQLQGAKDALVGGPGVDRKTAALQAALPIAGITVSKGAPGGPAMGDYYAAKDEHDFQVQTAMPHIQQQIRQGDVVGARKAMTELGIAPGLQNYYVRVARNPGLRMSGRKLRDFERFADDRQKAQFARDRAANAGRGQ